MINRITSYALILYPVWTWELRICFWSSTIRSLASWAYTFPRYILDFMENWYYIIFAKVNKPPPPPPPKPPFSFKHLTSLWKPVQLIDSQLIYFHVLGELWSSRKFQLAFSSHPKLWATLIVPIESSRTFLLPKFTVSRFALIPKWSRDKTIIAISWSAGKKWKHNLGNS